MNRKEILLRNIYKYATSGESLINSLEDFADDKLKKVDIAVIISKHKEVMKRLEKIIEKY